MFHDDGAPRAHGDACHARLPEKWLHVLSVRYSYHFNFLYPYRVINCYFSYFNLLWFPVVGPMPALAVPAGVALSSLEGVTVGVAEGSLSGNAE